MDETPPREWAGDGPGRRSGGAPPRTGLQLLRDPTIGPYFFAKLASACGVWIYNIVAAIFVYEITRSALLVGAVSIFQFTPQLLLAPWMGMLADRGNRRVQAIVGRCLCAVGMLGLGGWIGFVGVDAVHGAGVVLASALVVGIGFAMTMPAMHALIPSLVRPEELPAVVALDTAPITTARALGPALGALLLATTGSGATFLVAGATQLALAITTAFLRIKAAPRPKDRDRTALGGLRHLRADPVVALLMLGVIGIGLGVDPVITLTPPLAADLGEGAQLVAMMASSFGVGAATAPIALALARRRLAESQIATLGLATIAVSWVGLAASPTPTLALGVLYVGGVGMMLGITSFTTAIQQRLPDDLRGRIMALWGVCFVGSRPLAAALNGAIADWLSARAALLALVVVLAVIVLLTRPARVSAPAPSAA